MSADSMPAWGLASGALSSFTARAGRPTSVPEAAGAPVSGQSTGAAGDAEAFASGFGLPGWALLPPPHAVAASSRAQTAAQPRNGPRITVGRLARPAEASQAEDAPAPGPHRPPIASS